MDNQLKQVTTPWLTAEFARLVNNYQFGRFAHALLFTGHAGVGKFKHAQKIAQYLLCSNKQHDGACLHCHSCSLFAAQNHLDFHLIQNEANKTIGIDQVRGLIEVINQRPNLGDNKVVIIKNAQELTPAAANALLKTLEEPQGHCYIILLAPSHHQLMPTLLSRVQHIHLHTPDDSLLLSWLAEQGVIVEDKGLLRLFQNSPLAILNHLQNEQVESSQDERRTCVEGLFSLLNQPETLFDFSRFIAESVEQRLQLLFYMLHDLHKLKLSPDVTVDDAVYGFALPQLQIWQAQISLKGLRTICGDLLKTRNMLLENSGVKKDLLINALLIKIKNEFKDI